MRRHRDVSERKKKKIIYTPLPRPPFARGGENIADYEASCQARGAAGGEGSETGNGVEVALAVGEGGGLGGGEARERWGCDGWE